MTEQLGVLLDAFNGDFSRTRCFLHILNLVAKSMLRQFDVKTVGDVKEGDDDVRALLELARDLEAEERETEQERQQEQGESENAEEDNDEMWVDEVASLDDNEREEFEREVRPVKMVLAKVSGRRVLGEIKVHSHRLTDLPPRLQNSPFHDQGFARVECYFGREEATAAPHLARREDTAELYL